MFRIERNLVNLSDKRTNKFDSDNSDTEAAIDEPAVESGRLNINPEMLVDEAKKRARKIIENARESVVESDDPEYFVNYFDLREDYERIEREVINRAGSGGAADFMRVR